MENRTLTYYVFGRPRFAKMEARFTAISPPYTSYEEAREFQREAKEKNQLDTYIYCE